MPKSNERVPRFFTTLPARAIADTRLTALDLRCLAVIALHDGMSADKGTGAGCFAAYRTLAPLVRTDVTNFSKSVTRLIKLDYVAREPQLMDKRRFTLRVQYPKDDSWRTDQQSPVPFDPETGEIVGEATSDPAEIVGEPETENGSFPSEIDLDYIPSNGELHSEESGESHSVESAQQTKSRTPENGSDLFTALNAVTSDEAQLAIFERTWKARPDIIAQDCEFWTEWLSRLEERATGWCRNTARRAGRLIQDVCDADQVDWSASERDEPKRTEPGRLKVLRVLIRDHLQSTGKYARDIVQHPACRAAGLSDSTLSQIRNGRVASIRADLADAIITAISN